MMNYNDLKLFSKEELIEMVPEGFTWKTEPWKHQISAFLASISEPGFLCALDLGTGKTKVSIDYCRFLDDNRGNIRALVICMNSAVENVRDEVNIHSDLTAQCLRGPSSDKMDILNEGANFNIINYEGLRALLTEKVSIDGLKNKKQVISSKAVDRFMKVGNFDAMIIDESHLVKTPKSLNFKLAKKIGMKTPRRLLLTGTPFGNSLLDIWAQYFLVDFGETFDTAISRFRAAYFEDKGWFGPDWRVTKDGEKAIQSKLFSKAIRYKEDEVDDLPEKVFRVKAFNLSTEQRKVYNDLTDNIYDERTDAIGSKYNAFRTIASGFIKSSEYLFKTNPKLELLSDLIDEVVDRHKVVIFTEFIISHDIICKMLKKKKIKYCHVSGKTKNNHEQVVRFQKDPSYRIMVANRKSGGSSINLFAATYMVNYELGGSIIEYKQSIKRIHRGGQKFRCFFYTLLGKSTLEMGMYKNLQNGVDAFNRIVDPKKFVEGG